MAQLSLRGAHIAGLVGTGFRPEILKLELSAFDSCLFPDIVEALPQRIL